MGDFWDAQRCNTPQTSEPLGFSQRMCVGGSVTCARHEKKCVCFTLCAFDEVFCFHLPSRARHSLMSAVKKQFLHGLNESVGITLPTHVGLAILLGLVRAILLTPTTLLKLRMRPATSGISSCGCATQGLLAVFH